MRLTLPNILNDIQNTKHRIAYWFAVIGLTVGIFLVYVNNLWWDEPGLALDEFLNGTASKPYVYRILVPALVKVVISIAPLIPAKTVASILIYLSLLGFVISIRYLSMAFWKPSVFTDLIALLSPVALSPLMLVANHIYDFSILFLFTLGLALLAHARLRSFLLLFPIACMAKETSLLLTFVFVIYFYQKINRRLFYQLLFFQIVIFGGIRFVLNWIFRNNPGGAIEFHLTEWFFAVSIAPVLMLVVYIVFGFLLGIFIIYDWNNKPIFLRQAALVIIPVLSVLHLFFGMPLELRVFYEAYPTVFLLSIHGLNSFLGIKIEDAAQPVIPADLLPLRLSKSAGPPRHG